MVGYDTLSFCKSNRKDIIDISKLCFNKNYNLPIRYFNKTHIYDDLDFIKNVIKNIISEYKNYDFWWFEHAESAKIKTQSIFFKKVIVDAFKELNKSDQLYFVDNDLYPTKYKEDGFKFHSYPMMFGYTSIHPKTIKPRKFKKKFICLNRVDKPHRRDMFDFLIKNYKNDSYLSFAPEEPTNERHLVLDDLQIPFYKTLFARGFVSPHQTKSFCNIVTETTTYNKSIHITEKTDKCFTAGQPFILVSGPNYLKTLHNYGFKTFNKWWDESYDLESDYKKRIKLIKKNIDYISSLSIQELENIYIEMIPTLLHNQTLCKKYAQDGIYNLEYWEFVDMDNEIISKTNII